MQQWSPRFRAVLLDDDRQVAEVSSLRGPSKWRISSTPPQASCPAERKRTLPIPTTRRRPGLDGKRVVLRAEWRGEIEEVLRSDNAELLEQVAALLERVDPAKRVRVQGFGIRWW
jgi:hypothetical protein